MKETFKPITDELEKVDEDIYKLKDELKDLKGSEAGCSAAIEGHTALPEIEEPQDALRQMHESRDVNIDIDKNFKPEELDILEEQGLEKLKLCENFSWEMKTLLMII